jgi:hypothetical protein
VQLDRRCTSYPDFIDWRDQSRSFQAMAAFDGGSFALTGIDTPERIAGEYVSQLHFSLLGIQAALGRTFLGEEDQAPQRDRPELLRNAHFFGGPWSPALKRAWHKPQAWFTSSSCAVKPAVSLAAAREASRAVAAA